MEPREIAMDRLLKRTRATEPGPELSPDFYQRLMQELQRRLHENRAPRDRRVLLTAYGLVSAVTSAVAMRGQGLEWGSIAVAIFGPLAVIAAAATRTRRSRSHR